MTTDARTSQPVLQVPLPTAQMLERGTLALQAILQAMTPANADTAKLGRG